VAEKISAHLNAIQARLQEAEIASARAEVKAEEERRRRHRTLWTIAGVATVLFIAASVFLLLRYSANQRILRERSKTTVTALSTSHGMLVPYVIEDLHQLPRGIVLPELRQRFDASDETRRLRLAYGLASFGDLKADLLASQVPNCLPDEFENLVGAFSHSKAAAVSALEAVAQSAETNEDWRLQARLAMLALRLGAPQLAADICQPHSNPIRRSLFIDECSTWHGDLSRLGPLVEPIPDDALRSAIALTIGSVATEDVNESVKQTWQPILSDWYLNHADPGTHSAAGWALPQWNLEIPEIAASQQPAPNRHWYVNSVGMTMLELPAGSFTRQAETISAMVEQHITVPESFLLADCEVTRAQFQQFIDDPQYPKTEKPTDWFGSSFRSSPTDRHPVQSLSWYHAVLFCNWLSRKEGLTPAYERTGQQDKLGIKLVYDAWVHVVDANGYRLPREVEWEHACRAGSETSYHFGDDASLLHSYAVHRSSRVTAPCGSKLPNAWGCFDVHGNVWEWCQDWDRDLVGDVSRLDARMITEHHRALRGGATIHTPLDLRSATRLSTMTDSRSDTTGFRVARTQP
jgi:formylglycine-generating enzyme required for sulfatase activity